MINFFLFISCRGLMVRIAYCKPREPLKDILQFDNMCLFKMSIVGKEINNLIFAFVPVSIAQKDVKHLTRIKFMPFRTKPRKLIVGNTEIYLIFEYLINKMDLPL